jgi:hypothetical protein
MSRQFQKPAELSGSMPQHAEGTVQRVDTVGREIAVMLPTGLVVFDVACPCVILLRGEPIKLRVLQPGDWVRITFFASPECNSVRSLEVPPNCDFNLSGCHSATLMPSDYSSSAVARG